MKVLSADLMELSKLEMNGERVLLLTANPNFFALYTNKQLLHVFSSSTTELIKRGILIEGVCMVSSNSSNNRIALLTLKGVVHLYEIVNPDIQSIDGVKPLYKSDLQNVLKNQQSEMILGGETESVISVTQLRLHDNSNIEVYLSNNERFEYDP